MNDLPAIYSAMIGTCLGNGMFLKQLWGLGIVNTKHFIPGGKPAAEYLRFCPAIYKWQHNNDYIK